VVTGWIIDKVYVSINLGGGDLDSVILERLGRIGSIILGRFGILGGVGSIILGGLERIGSVLGVVDGLGSCIRFTVFDGTYHTFHRTNHSALYLLEFFFLRR
jgi:hypothetical protein